jgi:hypothetical protein
MHDFWQFFATGAFSLFVGIAIGRSMAISQILLAQQQQKQPSPMDLQAMQQMFARPGVQPPGGNGPAL